ncbi:hypothetical protein VTJ04DRAFT_5035 [Mycothermus thermophilus]|uniref:uncharacterized protein n=1 Tax=Humicola insolens TaxID=85995 RepID=UPI0037433380
MGNGLWKGGFWLVGWWGDVGGRRRRRRRGFREVEVWYCACDKSLLAVEAFWRMCFVWMSLGVCGCLVSCQVIGASVVVVACRLSCVGLGVVDVRK